MPFQRHLWKRAKTPSTSETASLETPPTISARWWGSKHQSPFLRVELRRQDDWHPDDNAWPPVRSYWETSSDVCYINEWRTSHAHLRVHSTENICIQSMMYWPAGLSLQETWTSISDSKYISMKRTHHLTPAITAVAWDRNPHQPINCEGAARTDWSSMKFASESRELLRISMPPFAISNQHKLNRRCKWWRWMTGAK